MRAHLLWPVAAAKISTFLARHNRANSSKLKKEQQQQQQNNFFVQNTQIVFIYTIIKSKM